MIIAPRISRMRGSSVLKDRSGCAAHSRRKRGDAALPHDGAGSDRAAHRRPRTKARDSGRAVHPESDTRSCRARPVQIPLPRALPCDMPTSATRPIARCSHSEPMSAISWTTEGAPGRQPKASSIKTNQAKGIAQCLDLRLPHFQIERPAMHHQDRRSAPVVAGKRRRAPSVVK